MKGKKKTAKGLVKKFIIISIAAVLFIAITVSDLPIQAATCNIKQVLAKQDLTAKAAYNSVYVTDMQGNFVSTNSDSNYIADNGKCTTPGCTIVNCSGRYCDIAKSWDQCKSQSSCETDCQTPAAASTCADDTSCVTQEQTPGPSSVANSNSCKTPGCTIINCSGNYCDLVKGWDQCNAQTSCEVDCQPSVAAEPPCTNDISYAAPVQAANSSHATDNSNCDTSSCTMTNYSDSYQSLVAAIWNLLNSKSSGMDSHKSTASESVFAASSTQNQPAELTSVIATSGELTDHEARAIEEQVLVLVNNLRAQNGLGSLTMNEQLRGVARTKSKDLSDKNYFDHQSPTYGSPFDMMTFFGISYNVAGENIAYNNSKSAQTVFDMWKNSPGHLANMLGSKYTKIGIGVYKNASGRYFWTQMFTD